MRLPQIVLRPFFLLLNASSAWSCAHGQSAQERQLAEMREELSRVQAEHDRFDKRLSALEMDVADPKQKTPAPTSSDPAYSSNLRVVRLTPERPLGGAPPPDSPDSPEATNAPGTRPTLRVTGNRSPSSRRAGSSDQVEQTLADEPTSKAPRDDGPRLSALDKDAHKAYEAALVLVRNKQYNRALEAFAAFLVRWPDHPNADNAMYWRGECYFAESDYTRAIEQFEGLIARFPAGNKVADALLKLGISYQKLSSPVKAKVYFERLQREFPESESARRIPREESR